MFAERAGFYNRRPTPARRSTTTSRRTTATSTSASTTARTTRRPRPTTRRRSRFAAPSGRSRRAARAARPARAPASTTATTTSRTPSASASSGSVTFEHPYLNAGFDYLNAQRPDVGHRRPRRRRPGLLDLGDAADAAGNGASVEALLRYDHLTPNTRQRRVDGDAGRGSANASSASPTGSRTRATSSTRAAARLRRPDVRQHHAAAAGAEDDRRCTGWSTSRQEAATHERHAQRLAIAGCVRVALVRRRRRADGADQRRRRDVPEPDLLEVVLRVQQAAPERARSTTSRSDRAAASGRSPTRRCSSAPPTAR